MKHGFRPRLTPNRISTRDFYLNFYKSQRRTVHSIQIGSKMLMSREMYDAATSKSIGGAIAITATLTGMAIEVSPHLPFSFQDTREHRRRAKWDKIKAERRAGKDNDQFENPMFRRFAEMLKVFTPIQPSIYATCSA